jgi:hypothetical protein
MRGEYDEIGRMCIKIVQQRAHGVRLGTQDFSNVETELSHRLSWTAIRQQAPTRECGTDAWEIAPVHILLIRSNMHQAQFGPGEERQLEGMGKRHLTRWRKVRRMKDTVQDKTCCFRLRAYGQLSPQYPIPIFSGKNLTQGLCSLTLTACVPPRTPNTSAGPFHLGRHMVQPETGQHPIKGKVRKGRCSTATNLKASHCPASAPLPRSRASISGMGSMPTTSPAGPTMLSPRV